MKMEEMLNIKESSSKDLRRYVNDWGNLDESDKRITKDKLIHAIKKYSENSDILGLLKEIPISQ